MKILLLGAKGQLGHELNRTLTNIGQVKACSRKDLNVENRDAIVQLVAEYKPQVIVNATAYTAVDKAESESDLAFKINNDACKMLAEEALKRGINLIHYSTDYVFDGRQKQPYSEDDETNPINVYGASKLAGERSIINSGCNHLIFRTTWVIGRDGNNFAKTILKLSGERETLNIIDDQFGVPATTAFISQITSLAIEAMIAGEDWPRGIYNLVPNGQTTWYGIARLIVDHARESGIELALRKNGLIAIPTLQYPTPAKRPMYSGLDNSKLEQQIQFLIPDWETALKPVVKEIIEDLKSNET